MKYRLRAFEKKTQIYNTERKEFKLPYLDPVLDGPIISVEDWKELHDFFVMFNTLTRDLQIGLEYIKEDKGLTNKEVSEDGN